MAAQWHDDAVLDELVGAEAAAAARVYDRAAAYLRTTPGEVAAQLQLAARRTGNEQLADRIDYRGGLPWSTRWLLVEEEQPHRTVAALEAPVATVWSAGGCAGAADLAGGYGVWSLPDGEPLLAGGLDHHLWPGRIAGLSSPDGRHLLVEAELGKDGDAGWLVLWELAAGTPVEADRVALDLPLRAVHAAASVVAGADRDGVLWRWTVEGDPPRLSALPALTLGGGAFATAGAGVRSGGRPVLVVGSDLAGGAVVDLRTGARTGLRIAGSGAGSGAGGGAGGDGSGRGAIDAHAATAGRLPGGQEVAVTVDHRDGLRLFDLATGLSLTDPRRMLRPTTVALDPAGVLTGGADGVLRLWDPRPWFRPPTPPLLLSMSLAAACTTLSDGRRVAVVGHENRRVLVWDLVEGQPPATALHGDHYAVGVACVGDLAVTAGLDGRVEVFDVAAGVGLHTFVMPHAEPLPGTGSYRLPGNPTPTDPPPGDPPPGDAPTADAPPADAPEPVRAVAAGLTTGGQAVAVSLGDHGWLRRWDLTGGRALGAVRLADRGQAIACAHLDDVPVYLVATARHLEVHDLATGALLARHALPRQTLVAALGAIDETVVALGWDGRLHRWRLADGSPLGEPLTGHYRDARTISCGRWGGRPIAVTGGYDGTVRVWDLDAGRQLHRIPIEEPVYAVALADDLSILVGTDAGIGVLRLEDRW